MTILGDIFYFLGLFLFFISISKTLSYFKFIDVKEWVIKYKEITQKTPEKSDFRKENEYSFFVGFGCLSIIESIWLVCGLLSSSWLIFAIIVISGILLRQLLSLAPFYVQKIIGFSFNLIKSITILVLVINHFHYNIDIYQYLINLSF